MKPRVQKIMDNLRVSEKEAFEILSADKAIDRGERMPFDLSSEAEKEAKKILRGERKPITAKPRGKKDIVKEQLFNEILVFLVQLQSFDLENVKISEKKNEITFILDDNSYSLKIIRHKKEKI